MDLEKVAIMRLREGAEISKYYYNKPLLLCYSGGKDSEIILDLALKSGIDFELQHSHTTADAPETVYHIRKKFKELELKGMPPTRLVRYCCSILKETAGANRAIATGIRRAESVKRKSRGIFETYTSNKKNKIILNNDNDDKRRVIEHCQLQGKTIINPICDWSDNDVKEYIHQEHIILNPLYSCGFSRVGCIGCPMAGKKRFIEFARYPKYRDMYIRAFDKMVKFRKQNGKAMPWANGLDVFHWWMEDNVLPGQLTIDGENDW